MEFVSSKTKFIDLEGQFFMGLDMFYRSSFSSNPTPSEFLIVNDYALLNGRIGFQTSSGLTIFVWGRNILNKHYYEQLLVGPGNVGYYAGVLGDPTMNGITARFNISK